jgi:hypothetical protein
VRKGAPDRFEEAHTQSWSDNAHFLLVTIDGDEMRVRPIGELVEGAPHDLVRYTPAGTPAPDPIVIRR